MSRKEAKSKCIIPTRVFLKFQFGLEQGLRNADGS